MLIRFAQHVAKQKPNTIRESRSSCPFCERESLSDVYESRGDMIWLKNKYQVIEKAHMTVLVETKECFSEFGEYPREKAVELLRFALEKWDEMEKSGKYKSVMLYKNHGPMSGGSLRHPHMQIVGFEDIDCFDQTLEEHFEGAVIDDRDGVEFNVSAYPRVGFVELNAKADSLGEKQIEALASCAQKAVGYFAHARGWESYNLFFYRIKGKTRMKAVPRHVTSPLHVGYSIRQVASNVEEIAEEIRKMNV